MAPTEYDNFSEDLLWEVTRFNSSFIVKRRHGGAAVFSRDPLNVKGEHCRKFDGVSRSKAIGIKGGEDGGVTLITKKNDKANKPGSLFQTTTFPQKQGTRKTYASIAKATAKRGYRPDLLPTAIARASAIRKSQRPVKDDRPTKLRGSKAKRAAEGLKA